jgi:hypothetical protein
LRNPPPLKDAKTDTNLQLANKTARHILAAPEICKKHNFQDMTPFDAPAQYRSTPFSPSQKKKRKKKREKARSPEHCNFSKDPAWAYWGFYYHLPKGSRTFEFGPMINDQKSWTVIK